MRTRIMVVVFLGLSLFMCDKNPVIEDNTLDGDILFDASTYDPESFLVSHAYSQPTSIERDMPVVVAAHGYTASTYEWQELRDWADTQGDFLVSQVLLGGHGVDYETFKSATWEDWKVPILTEYYRLDALGFTNISLAGSSTGCPLIIKLLAEGAFDEYQTPREIFLVDPMLIPSNKLLSIIRVVGPMIGYSETDVTDETRPYWYTYRPQETLQELMELSSLARKDLEDGITLDVGTRLKVYKSIRDASADAIGALMIYKGIELSDGSAVDVDMIDSEIHVMTRLAGHEDPTQADWDNQAAIFKDMQTRMTD